MEIRAIWMLIEILWLIPIRRHSKNKFSFGACFSNPLSQGSTRFSEKHPYLLIYDRYWKMFPMKFVAWTIRDILSYVQNFVRTFPLPLFYKLSVKNTWKIYYFYFTSKLTKIGPYWIESKLFRIIKQPPPLIRFVTPPPSSRRMLE